LFHRVKEDFEEIRVVWKNSGLVACMLWWLEGWSEMWRLLTPSILFQTMSWGREGTTFIPVSWDHWRPHSDREGKARRATWLHVCAHPDQLN
jgi:hypothetical protein